MKRLYRKLNTRTTPIIQKKVNIVNVKEIKTYFFLASNDSKLLTPIAYNNKLIAII